MLGLGPMELLLILTILGILALPVWGIIDASVRPGGAYQGGDAGKAAWIAAQLLLAPLATLVYLFVRPGLKRRAAQLPSAGSGAGGRG